MKSEKRKPENRKKEKRKSELRNGDQKTKIGNTKIHHEFEKRIRKTGKDEKRKYQKSENRKRISEYQNRKRLSEYQKLKKWKIGVLGRERERDLPSSSGGCEVATERVGEREKERVGEREKKRESYCISPFYFF